MAAGNKEIRRPGSFFVAKKARPRMAGGMLSLPGRSTAQFPELYRLF